MAPARVLKAGVPFGLRMIAGFPSIDRPLFLQYNQLWVGMTRLVMSWAARAAAKEKENPVGLSAARRWLSCVLGFSAAVALLLACDASQTAPTQASPTQAVTATATPTVVPTVPETIRVLFVGNSLTFFNDLPTVFAELARSGGYAVEVGMSAQRGQTLAEHAASPTTLEKLTGQRWNFVVLQEQSRIPAIAAQRSEQMIPAVRLLDGMIDAEDAGTVLLMTWASRDGLPGAGFEDYVALQAAIEVGYLEAAGEIGAAVAPAGVVWRRALEGHSELELWQSDGSHPTREGTYLTACVLYATLLGTSPEGASYLVGLPEETARFLQAVAAETVLSEPERWNLP